MSIEFFGHSYIGRKREFNEDSLLCADFSDGNPGRPQPFYLFAVADGIGGHAGGEVASALAVQTLMEKFEQLPDAGEASLDLKGILEGAFHQANRLIYRRGAEAERLTGMGTTLVAAAVTANTALVANVGDSRLYLIRGDSLSQISQDHNWAAEQLRRRLLSEKEIVRSPFRNLVTRSLGYGPETEVDSYRVPLQDGDWLLLCTDGLYGYLPDRAILKNFKKGENPENVCRTLIRAADKKGSLDNITAVVVRVREG
jgi:serine/threonine protein phosphatase PrpC